MFCTNCGKPVAPETRFCTHCGTDQTALPAAAPPQPFHAQVASSAAPAVAMHTPTPLPTAALSSGRGVTPAIWAVVGTLAVAILGGLGYWGWSNKVAGEETANKLTAVEEQRRLAAEQASAASNQAAEAQQILAAQAAMDKRIEVEEAQARANPQTQPGQAAQSPAPPPPVKR